MGRGWTPISSYEDALEYVERPSKMIEVGHLLDLQLAPLLALVVFYEDVLACVRTFQ